jgi:hypothetical protein
VWKVSSNENSFVACIFGIRDCARSGWEGAVGGEKVWIGRGRFLILRTCRSSSLAYRATRASGSHY